MAHLGYSSAQAVGYSLSPRVYSLRQSLTVIGYEVFKKKFCSNLEQKTVFETLFCSKSRDDSIAMVLLQCQNSLIFGIAQHHDCKSHYKLFKNQHVET